MTRYPLLIFVIFLKVFDIVHCENVTFSSFNRKPNIRAELNEAELSEGKGMIFDQKEVSPEAKIIGKRRLFFNEGDVNSPVGAQKEFEIKEASSRRRSNVTEIQTQMTEHRKGYNDWENHPSKFSFPVQSGDSGNPPKFQSRQPFVGLSDLNFSWGPRSHVSDARKHQWNGEKNFHHAVHHDSHSRAGNNYGGRVPQIPNRNDANNNVHESRNGEVFDRVSMTTLNDGRMLNEENSYEKVGDIYSANLGTSNMNYYNRNSKDFWDGNLHRPEKGVIINFNTECPVPRQYSNHQMVHKFIFTPKSISTQREISPFHLPKTTLISGQQMAPLYYL